MQPEQPVQPQQPQPVQPVQPEPQQPQIPTPLATQPIATDPGKTLGVVSLVTSLLNLGVVGLITGIIGLKKSKAAGYRNGLAKAGIIISSIEIVLAIILFSVVFLPLVSKCNELGPGEHYVDGVTYTCS